MTAVQAVYDGNVFIPEKPCEITKGSKVTLTINAIDTGFSEKQKKLASFRQLTKEVKELNKTDPLPLKFDEILSKRVQIREISSL
jgi:predicted DNA-binding antitoxin AbrB/MazE fold protein